MESRVILEVLKHQDSSLSAGLSAFMKTFSKPQQFRGAYVLLTLLQEGLLSVTERVAAIFADNLGRWARGEALRNPAGR